MIKNQMYKKTIDKKSYLNLVKDIGIENMELSKETIMYYEPRDNQFSHQKFQYKWLELIINETKEETKAKLKYIHTYPENEIYTTMKEEYQTEITNVEDFQKIMQRLNFIISSKDKKKKIQSDLMEKYILTLYNTNEAFYEIEIRTMDSHYITREEFEEINSFFIKYNIKPDEEF